MKQFKFVALVFLVSALAVGCSQKKEVGTMPPLGVEGEDKDVVQTISTPEVIEVPGLAQQPVQQIPAEANPVPVSPAMKAEQQPVAAPMGPEGMDRNKQIQAALKNANLYFGEVDGKMGPLTRKAVEEFQKMKGLKVDGKVGPVTWGELQKYLNPPVTTTTKTRR